MRRILVLVLLTLAIVVLGTWLASCNNPSSPSYNSGGAGNDGGGGGNGSGGGGGGGGGSSPELNGNLAAGSGQYSHTFNTAGTFNYRCTIHPSCSGLAGTVVVVPSGTPVRNRVLAISFSGGGSGYYGGSCSGLSNQLDTVQVGDQVVWSNGSALPHTVTSR